MNTTRGGWLGLWILWGCAVGCAMLAVFGAILAGWLPWPTLFGVWLGGNALFLCLVAWRPRRTAGGRHSVAFAVGATTAS